MIPKHLVTKSDTEQGSVEGTLLKDGHAEFFSWKVEIQVSLANLIVLNVGTNYSSALYIT